MIPGLPHLSVRLHGSAPLAECTDVAHTAERAGFRSLWFSEDPFSRGALPLMAAAGVATDRIRIASGVVNPYNRHPTLIAMEFAALDELTDGRAVLGIGSGVTNAAAMGFESPDPVAAIRDSVAIVRGMFDGRTVDHAGRQFSAFGARLDPPCRSEIPIFVGAMGPANVRQAGSSADGLIISNMCTPGYTQWATGELVSAAHSARRRRPYVVQYLPCALSDDRAAGRAAAREFIALMLPLYRQHLGARFRGVYTVLRDTAGVDPDRIDAVVDAAGAGQSGSDLVGDDLIAEFLAAGTVDDCLEHLARLRSAGADEVALWPLLGDPAGLVDRVADAVGHRRVTRRHFSPGGRG